MRQCYASVGPDGSCQPFCLPRRDEQLRLPPACAITMPPSALISPPCLPACTAKLLQACTNTVQRTRQPGWLLPASLHGQAAASMRHYYASVGPDGSCQPACTAKLLQACTITMPPSALMAPASHFACRAETSCFTCHLHAALLCPRPPDGCCQPACRDELLLLPPKMLLLQPARQP